MSAFARTIVPLLLMLALVAGAFAVAPLNPLLPPNPPLDGRFANIMLVVTETGNNYALALICSIMLLIVVGRPGVPSSRRVFELCSLGLALLLAVGAGGLANETVLKPHFSVPRPNIVALSTTPPTVPFLRISAAEFYACLSPSQRRNYLEHVLKTLPPRGVPMSPQIRRHWVKTVGYSFPSGHAFAAYAIATFFFLLGARFLVGWRLGVCYLALPWAVLVAYSRTVLRVHTPTDVLAGAVLGVGVATLAYVVWRACAHFLVRSPG